MLYLFRRLDKQYGITEFREALAKSEKWINDKIANSFDLTGQFEDVDVLGLKPYQNLCNATFGNYSRYLFNRDGRTPEDLALGKELIALAEDQFVHWDVLVKEDGTKEGTTPCVYEQYHYKTPIDASAVTVGSSFLALYKATGDKLAFAKA